MTERVTKSDCIFCRIVSGEVRADVVFDGGDTLFFRDRSPRARVHLLGIPKSHLESLAQVSDSDEVLLGKIQRDIAKV
ncbi:HIT domain-containing protein, partial [Patescibacteria group bacterium]|nr:HIT domain-containing protein [Patescibacteria group bacterium]